MKFFKKLAKLFGKKEKEVPVQEETVTASVNINAEVVIDKAPDPKPANVVEEVPVEEKEASFTFIPFTEEDKEKVLEVLRPVIKALNSDDLYANLCSILAETKVLKTFAKITDDGKCLSISLTQSAAFNNKIGDYLDMCVVKIFKDVLNKAGIGTFDLVCDSDNGVIDIRRIG